MQRSVCQLVQVAHDEEQVRRLLDGQKPGSGYVDPAAFVETLHRRSDGRLEKTDPILRLLKIF